MVIHSPGQSLRRCASWIFFILAMSSYRSIPMPNQQVLKLEELMSQPATKSKKKEPALCERKSFRQDMICNATPRILGAAWEELCQLQFIQAADDFLRNQNPDEDGDDPILHIIQIGAHVGFKSNINDPLWKHMSKYIRKLTQSEKQRVQWTFIEPAPNNYKFLVKNIEEYSRKKSLGIKMVPVNGAIVPDSTPDEKIKNDPMTFYSVVDSVDPITHVDSKSGQKLAPFITQISSLDLDYMYKNYNKTFLRKGLKVEDYFVGTNVTLYRYTDLMHNILYNDTADRPTSAMPTKKRRRPFLVMIDTEGFDCSIIRGIDQSSPYLPYYFLFEHKHCVKPDGIKEESYKHMKNTLKYGHLKEVDFENTIAAFYNNNALAPPA